MFLLLRLHLTNMEIVKRPQKMEVADPVCTFIYIVQRYEVFWRLASGETLEAVELGACCTHVNSKNPNLNTPQVP